MDDGGHGIEGYVQCRTPDCHIWVLDVIARRTGGVCAECFAVDGALRDIEIINRGQRMVVAGSRSRDRTNKGRRDTAKTAEHCRRRAMVRLKNIFSDLYDVLYADERAKAGLDPWPLERALIDDGDPDGSKTISFAQLYCALDQRGVDVDAQPA